LSKITGCSGNYESPFGSRLRPQTYSGSSAVQRSSSRRCSIHTLVETVARLCRADLSTMFRRGDDKYHLVASYGLSGEAKEFFHTHPVARGRSTLSVRVELERRVVHIPDVSHIGKTRRSSATARCLAFRCYARTR